MIEITDATVTGDATIDAGNATRHGVGGRKGDRHRLGRAQGRRRDRGLSVKTGNGYDVVAVLGQPAEEAAEGEDT